MEEKKKRKSHSNERTGQTTALYSQKLPSSELSSRILSLNKIYIVQYRHISFRYIDTLFICILHAPLDIITYIVHTEMKVDNISPFGVKHLLQCYEFGG